MAKYRYVDIWETVEFIPQSGHFIYYKNDDGSVTVEPSPGIIHQKMIEMRKITYSDDGKILRDVKVPFDSSSQWVVADCVDGILEPAIDASNFHCTSYKP